MRSWRERDAAIYIHGEGREEGVDMFGKLGRLVKHGDNLVVHNALARC